MWRPDVTSWVMLPSYAPHLTLLLPALLHSSPLPPGVRIVGEECMGVALTRYHLLTPSSCLGGRSRVEVEVVGRRRVSSGSLLPWHHPSLSLVGMDRVLAGGGGWQVGAVVEGEQVLVRGEQGEVPCPLGDGGELECGEEQVEVGGAVVGEQGQLVGVVVRGLALAPLGPSLRALKVSVAADLRARHRAGARAVLKCRRSEALALQALLEEVQGVQGVGRMEGLEEVQRVQEVQGVEVMLRDGTPDLASELSEVVRELKEELAGEEGVGGMCREGGGAGGAEERGGEGGGGGGAPAEGAPPQGGGGGPAEGPVGAPVPR